MEVALPMAVRMEEAFLDVFLFGRVSVRVKDEIREGGTDSRAALPKTVEMPRSLIDGW
jgi:hypothetical protein